MSEHILIPADTRYCVGNKETQQNMGKPLITNEMKAECIGKFFWVDDAPYYDEKGEMHESTAINTVPWSLCKEIYVNMAKVAAKKIDANSLSADEVSFLNSENERLRNLSSKRAARMTVLRELLYGQRIWDDEADLEVEPWFYPDGIAK